MNQLISVIIPTYNRGNIIGNAIESVLNQTYKNYEIIVADDNSSDDTEKVIKTYMDKYSFIRYCRHEKNQGGSAARNTGATIAKGGFISFLDSDDRWINTKLEKEMEVFKINRAIDMVYSNMILVDIETGSRENYRQQNYNDKLFGLLCKNIIGSTSLITIKKQVFDEVGGFTAGLPACQDWDFYLKVVQRYKIEKIDEYLLEYYIHSNSISGNLNNAIKGHELITKKVLDIMEQNNNFSKREKNYILCCQFENIAQIYNKFKEFDLAKEFYYKAMKTYKFKNSIIKNLLFMNFGKKVYYRLKKC